MGACFKWSVQIRLRRLCLMLTTAELMKMSPIAVPRGTWKGWDGGMVRLQGGHRCAETVYDINDGLAQEDVNHT